VGFVSRTSVTCGVLSHDLSTATVTSYASALWARHGEEDCVTNPKSTTYEVISTATSFAREFPFHPTRFMKKKLSKDFAFPFDPLPTCIFTLFYISGAIYAEFPLFWEYYSDYYLAFKFARR